MAKKIIKHRLFTWFEDVESPVQPGTQVRMERIAHFGDDVDISDDASLARGKELDAFFSDKEAKAIRAGTYDGQHAALLQQFKSGQKPATLVQDLEDEGPDTSNLSAEELGTYINENKLNVGRTVELATEGDVDSINRVYDAEIAAAHQREEDPRKGVTDRLDAMLAAASSQ